jgi:site-specific recombinase XerD
MNCRKWIEKYSIDCRLKYNSENTHGNYISQVTAFLFKFEKLYREPKEIPTEEIKLWILEKDSPNTRNHRLCAVKSFYVMTVQMPLKIDSIPFTKKDKKLPQPLEMEEMLGMIKACQNKKHLVILYLLYGCGLRNQELINLKWSHIDRAANVIYVVQGKGKKDRKVQLFPDLIRVLTEYYRAYPELRSSEYVLKGQFTSQYSQKSVNEVLKQLAKKAGIKRNVYAHLLRHGYASHLLDAGVDLRTIQELLGHSNIDTTMIYTHISKKKISSTVSPMTIALAGV